MNCSRPSMDTALVEKLQRTYMLAAMWKKEKWLKVERSIGEQRVSAGDRPRLNPEQHLNAPREGGAHSLEAGLEVKYLTMDRCRDGTLQQRKTTAFTAMIPGEKEIYLRRKSGRTSRKSLLSGRSHEGHMTS